MDSSNKINKPVLNPIWLSVSESAKLGGVQQKTIRRAIKTKKITYKIVNNRYQIELASMVNYMSSSTKLRNKLKFNGIGQYIVNWRE